VEAKNFAGLNIFSFVSPSIFGSSWGWGWGICRVRNLPLLEHARVKLPARMQLRVFTTNNRITKVNGTRCLFSCWISCVLLCWLPCWLSC